MNRILKIWNDLDGLTTNRKVVDYWAIRQNIIVESLKATKSDFEIAICIQLKIAKALNELDNKYELYNLYKTSYCVIENKLPESEKLNELKFQIAKGLFLNRKFEQAKKLFNELAVVGFESEKFTEMWRESVRGTYNSENWISMVLKPGIFLMAIILAYIVFAIQTGEFYITTTILLILIEVFDRWNFRNKIINSFKDFNKNSFNRKIEDGHKRSVLYPLGLVFLFYPIYYINNELLEPLVFITGIVFLGVIRINNENMFYSVWELTKSKYRAKKNTTR